MINSRLLAKYCECPLKAYHWVMENENKEREQDDVQEVEKELYVTVDDLIATNLLKVNKDMSYDEIVNTLSGGIKESMGAILDKYVDGDTCIYDVLDFKIRLLAIKVEQYFTICDVNLVELKKILFPKVATSNVMSNKQLGLISICDRIEIVDGYYYPVVINMNAPPLSGVDESDIIYLTANAILLEEDMKTEVFCGFVEYAQTNERRPVIFDVKNRKLLFQRTREVKEIVNNHYKPHKLVETDCENCRYYEKCKEEQA